MSITRIIKPLFNTRLKAIDLYATRPGEIQEGVLRRLLSAAAGTEWGRKYNYNSIKSYNEFRSTVPVQTYDDIKSYVERMRQGEQNILWPSDIIWFAKSSGTTNDKSKFLPVSSEALKNIHYKGGVDAVALYLSQNPQSRFFSGKGLILGGSHSLKPQSGGRPLRNPHGEHQSAGELHPRAAEAHRADGRVGEQD
jgi:hypothetical protein